MSLDDSLRRICSQAIFERINVYEVEDIDTVAADHGEPFDALFDPALHADALVYKAATLQGKDVKTADVAGLNIQGWVGPNGTRTNDHRNLPM